MSTLTTQLRNKLERTVIEARDVAESGAKEALEALAVHHHEPYGHMDPDARQLRRHLRARARQLGDRQDKSGRLDMRHIIHECAYEYWHRMLFARFLAENDLLIDPDMGVPITLAECEELARDAGVDKWVYASRCAQDMLPQIFRPDDPLLQVPFAANHRIELERLLDGLAQDTFTATDAIGWVYQFWQSKKKDEVNASGNKIGVDELPAVTQLFTEDYMVDFLLDNTLGAWWAGKVAGASSSGISGTTEAECRRASALPGCEWKYLRFSKVAGASSSGEDEQRTEKADKPELEAPATIAPDWETLKIQKGDNLPHWTCDNAIYHVCFRLDDSIPQTTIDEWKRERDDIITTAKQAGRDLSEDEEKRLRYLYSEKIEKYLDAGHGECWLKNPNVARLVADALRHFDGDRYRLHAWSIMPNHVHAIVEPTAGNHLGKIAHSWKSFTSNKANEILGRTGQFWQHEPYDHIIRSEKEYRFQVRYVWENPDKAGLKDWPWRKVASSKVDGASSSGDVEHGGQGSAEPEQDAPATTWKPAAGTYDGWPKTTAELKCLDPCCGSGHFLVAMLERLVPMRMAEEGLSKADAVKAVLRDNIHGLEIDPRCTQLAAFALALSAWKMIVAGASNSGKTPEQDAPPTFDLPQLNIACCGLEISGTKEEWCALAPGNNFIMNQVYDLFRNASTLGSLIDPVSQVKTGVGGPDIGSLKDAILQGLETFREDQDFERQELGVSGGGIIDAYEFLSKKYHLVVTNVPFLTQSKFSACLKEHIYSHFELAKENLASAFGLRMFGLCQEAGTIAYVSPQSWWFLKRYTNFREWICRQRRVQGLFRLGEKAFTSPQAGGELIALSVLANVPPSDLPIPHLDVASPACPEEKAAELVAQEVCLMDCSDIPKNPDFAFRPFAGGHMRIGDFASALQGLVTGDSAQYFGKFWERQSNANAWEFLQTTSDSTRFFGGMTDVILWENECGRLAALAESVKGINHSAQNWRKGKPNWGKPGVVVSQMGSFPATLYLGNIYDHNCCAIVPDDPDHVSTLWAFCLSEEFENAVRAINQNRKIEVGTILNTDCDLSAWKQKAEEMFPEGLPLPCTNDPTQWVFHGFPLECEDTLLVGVARLLGYRWPAETDTTLELAEHARNLRDRCKRLFPICDADGIVCIPSVRGEEPAADRLLALLRKAYSDEWTDTKVLELIAATGSKAKSLDDWLRNDFFEQHSKLFHHRPFIWHIWDGRKRDGFHALVNYHKLCGGRSFQLRQGEPEQDAPATSGRALLEKLTHSYLGEWITRQKDGVARGEGGAEDRLAAGVELQHRLLAILKGEPPFDIFVRWKPLHQQAIGWNPDINDGVRLNTRPFMASDLPGGKKGAGILRWKPNVKWGKDRGKEPHRPKDEYPWFWSWDESTQDFKGGPDFDGNRWNDLHYTNAAKETARERLTADHVEEQRE